VYAGHAAIALGAKAKRPQVSLALLVPVAFAPDWIEWFFNASGHRNQDISHSLVSIGLGATLVALLYGAARSDWSGAGAVWLTYALHWPADFVTGLKPTWPGGPIVGLYYYSKPGYDLSIEIVVIAACWMAYERSLPAESRRRAIRWLVPWGLIGLQLAFLFATVPGLRP